MRDPGEEDQVRAGSDPEGCSKTIYWQSNSGSESESVTYELKRSEKKIESEK